MISLFLLNRLDPDLFCTVAQRELGEIALEIVVTADDTILCHNQEFLIL